MPAKKGINLLKREYAIHGEKLINWILNVGRWIVVLTEFIVICAFLSRFYFDTKLADLFDEIKQKQAIVNSASALESEYLKYQFLNKKSLEVISKQKNFSLYLERISKIIPFDTYITTLDVDENSIKMTGFSLSGKSLSHFISLINSAKEFKELTISKISSDEQNPQIISFEISFKISKENTK